MRQESNSKDSKKQPLGSVNHDWRTGGGNLQLKLFEDYQTQNINVIYGCLP